MSSAADLFSAAGRVAVITGGGTGLGFSMAEAWVKNGGRVCITGRREETLKEAVAKLNNISQDSAYHIRADVSTQADIDRISRELSARETAVDVLVNNAGACLPDINSTGAPLPAFDSAVWGGQFAVNTWAPAALTSALSPLLIEAAKKGEGRGSVILISSVVEDFWYAGLPVVGYAVSKAAEGALTKILASKLSVHGVRVNTIKPGTFPTAMNDISDPNHPGNPNNVERNIPLKRNGAADDIAGIFLYFATRAGAYVTGQKIAVDGGWLLVGNGRPGV